MEKRENLTREQYKKLKRLDHRQMELFIVNICNDSYREGVKAGKLQGKEKVTLEQIESIVSQTKGIGEVKTKAIMQGISALYDGGNQNGNDSIR